jgi:hypothetical protein
METVAVFSFKMNGKVPGTFTCNLVDGLDITLGRIKERFDEMEKLGLYPQSDIVLNFVVTEK